MGSGSAFGPATRKRDGSSAQRRSQVPTGSAERRGGRSAVGSGWATPAWGPSEPGERHRPWRDRTFRKAVGRRRLWYGPAARGWR